MSSSPPQSFVDFLASLPAAQLDRLYGSIYTCQAVLRSLPPLAKHYILRLLFLDAPVPERLLSDWPTPDALSKHKAAIERLLQLRLLVHVQVDASGPSQSGAVAAVGSHIAAGQQGKGRSDVSIRLNPIFQKQLRHALTSGAPISRPPLPPSIAVRLPSPSDLATTATRQWEDCLLGLLSSPPSLQSSSSLEEMFLKAGLLSRMDAGSTVISPITYPFLMKDTAEQLWVLVSAYIAVCQEKGMDGGDVIAFLLELGFHSIGTPYSESSLSDLQVQVVRDMAHMGLVVTQKGTRDRWFIPTHLASSLSSSLSTAASLAASHTPTTTSTTTSDHTRTEAATSQGYIVLETNFRCYAYTASKLQAETLALFVRPLYRLPNLVVGIMSRETINNALALGISAEQIIQYLRHHAHPHVASKVPIVPETVTDQVRLWEHDRNRVAMTKAVLYDNIPTQDLFDSIVSHANQLGGLLWSSTTSTDGPTAADVSKPSAPGGRGGVGRQLAVRSDLHEAMKAFIRKAAAPRKHT